MVVILFAFVSCKDFGGDFFHIKEEKDDSENPVTEILNNFESNNITKKREAIITSAEMSLTESEPYLRQIILDTSALLNNRFLASRSYVRIFKDKAIDLANVLTLDYEYSDTSVAVELIYYVIKDESVNVDPYELKFQFESLFLYHFKRSSSFRIKSRTMITLSLLGVEELVPLIEDKLRYDNPILGETSVALAYLLEENYSKLSLGKLQKETIGFLKKTRDDNLRRLLRKALYIIKLRGEVIEKEEKEPSEEKETQTNENTNENNETTPPVIEEEENQMNIPTELLNTVSDLGSAYMIISLKAEEKIKKDIEKYKDILIESLYDTEETIIYKSSAILSEYAFPESCPVIIEALSDIANNKMISSKSELYIPTLRNLVMLSGKSHCTDALPLLKSLLSNTSLECSIMASFTEYSSSVLTENDINISPVGGCVYNSHIFQYLQYENDVSKLISLLSNKDRSIAMGSIYYIKQLNYESKYELIKEELTKVKDSEIKRLIKYYLININ